LRAVFDRRLKLNFHGSKTARHEKYVWRVSRTAWSISNQPAATITIEHPSGSIDVLAEYDLSDDGFTLISAGLIRTARKLADGNLYVPASVWGNEVQARQSEPKGVGV